MELALSHWAGLAVALVLGLVGIVAKRVLWTPATGGSGGLRAAQRFGRATMRIHPVAMGAALSLAQGLPCPLSTSGAGRALYFAAAGAASSWVYDAVRGAIRRWQGPATP